LTSWTPVGGSFRTLQVGRRGPVGWLVFDRPEVGNAMDATMLDELEHAWTALDGDPEVRVVVTTGEGRAFQTGLDMVQLSGDPDALRRQSGRTRRAQLRLTAWQNGVAKPVVAAVNGVCAGGGLHFVADADVVISDSAAQFMDPHVSVGQVAAYEVIALARKIPFEAVMRMALMGRHERMGAQRALQLGLVSRVVDPPDQLRDEAQALAETIARNSPAAMAATKRALWGALEEGLTDSCKSGATQLVSMWGHPDQTEGPLAFAEKREPVWLAPVGTARVPEQADGVPEQADGDGDEARHGNRSRQEET
jgi:enoyl-CoA hydratase